MKYSGTCKTKKQNRNTLRLVVKCGSESKFLTALKSSKSLSSLSVPKAAILC